jgi:hypothetical protein
MSKSNQVAIDCMKMVAAYRADEPLNVVLIHYWSEIAIAALQPYIAIMKEKFESEDLWDFYAAGAVAVEDMSHISLWRYRLARTNRRESQTRCLCSSGKRQQFAFH